MAYELLREKAAYPAQGTALAPDLVGISLATTITVRPGTSTGEREGVLAAARNAAENYINNLRVGEELIINEIADRIRNADVRITDVGEPNKQIPDLFIWLSRSDGTRYSRFLVNNYTPAAGGASGPGACASICFDICVFAWRFSEQSELRIGAHGGGRAGSSVGGSELPA